MPDRRGGYAGRLLAGKRHRLGGTSTVRLRLLRVGFCRLINTGSVLAPIEAYQSLYRLLHVARAGSGTDLWSIVNCVDGSTDSDLRVC